VIISSLFDVPKILKIYWFAIEVVVKARTDFSPECNVKLFEGEN
jgi:hypothetical protein